MTADAALSDVVRAWRAVGGSSETDRVEVVRGARDTTVYRLRTDDGPVIAKRCPSATAEVERAIYDRLLPALRLPRLRYYGSTPDPDASYCWLFIEEATGGRYRPDRAEHRAAAARWLAALHGSMGRPTAAAHLPPRRAAHYLSLLHGVLATLGEHRSDRAFGSEARRELLAVSTHCARLAERWHELEEACAGGPDTLVHGDLVTHNVVVRPGPSGPVFLPFDWEKAGWGSPAEDLSGVDLGVYGRSVAGHRPDFGPREIRRLAGAGRVFRCLVFLQWVGPDLATDPDAAIGHVRECRSWLDPIMDRASWS